jgi:hypothetical protein
MRYSASLAKVASSIEASESMIVSRYGGAVGVQVNVAG